jgi:hypothetical protein
VLWRSGPPIFAVDYLHVWPSVVLLFFFNMFLYVEFLFRGLIVYLYGNIFGKYGQVEPGVGAYGSYSASISHRSVRIILYRARGSASRSACARPAELVLGTHPA